MISHRKTLYTLKKTLSFHLKKGKEIIKHETLVNGKVISTVYGAMYFHRAEVDPKTIEANIAKKRIPKCKQS